MPVSNRWLRFVIALVALSAAGAAGFRMFEREQQLVAAQVVLRDGDAAADTAIETIAEIKSALHAYVAPGQGQAFWPARARQLLDKLRSSVLELDRIASSAGAPTIDALDLSDRLAAAEERAHEHVRAGQALLAGEVIFIESRDLLDTLRLQIARARGQLARTSDARHAQTRREQVLLALGGGGVLALALLMLVPPGRAADSHASVTISAGPAAAPPHSGAEEDEYARLIPTPKTAAPAPSAPDAPGAPHAPSVPDAPSAPAAPRAPSAPGLSETAAVCSELARISDGADVSAILTRAARVMNASGIIVWMRAEGGHELLPAASTGYDERLFARIGAISRDEANLTALAFRDAAPRVTARHGSSAAALAVPLTAPQGTVGVLSAEIKDVSHVGPPQLAIATIFAAQLSMLLGTISAAGESTPPQEAQA